MGRASGRRRGVGLKAVVVSAMLVAGFGFTAGTAVGEPASTAEYIVSDSAAPGLSQAVSDVLALGGQVVTDLTAANAVLADLNPVQVLELRAIPTVTVTANATVRMTSTEAQATMSGAAPAAMFPQQTGATQLWAKGDSGSGVNVAVVDTGIDPLPDFAGRLLSGVDLTGGGNPDNDQYGHGTFVAGLIAGDGATSGGLYKGEAPGAGLVPVKVAGASGATTMATVIEGIDWVIAHRVSENIGVMNLSLGYEPSESTFIDPLDQAVEQAWQAGIVVVVAAGNAGPFDGTILSPGDDPLVITVGAVDDHGSPSTANDTMARFSSVGPTNPDGWYKPDLVTSGTSVVSLAAPGSVVAQDNPQAVVGSGNFVGSGTSFSTAITSGAVALLLANHPNLQPNQVKAALLATTSPAPVGNPFVDGHGVLDVAAAASSPAGLQLQQQPGSLSLGASVPANTAIEPGESLEAGYSVQVPGAHPALTTSMVDGQLSIPVACSPGGAAVGDVQVPLPTTSYQVPADRKS